MKWLVTAIAINAFACGGGSGGGDVGGVPGDTRIVDLTDAETASVCDAEITAAGPERSVDCGGGTTITIGGETKQGCIDNVKATPTGCTATVNDVVACFTDIAAQTDAQVCSNQLPPSCATLFGMTCSPG